MRIAMWSGPRNLSTALMYSFANRSDFSVWDEPFYAPYLAASGVDHPMRDDIITAHDTNPVQVAARCIDTIPDQKPHFYMKHMPHHMIAGFPLAWTKHCVNVHLIRHPARVIASYAQKREHITVADIGFDQQLRLFQWVGGIVVDSGDIRRDPEKALRILCDAIGLNFDPAMLSWPKGPKPFDGIWAKHWYDAVHNSTGFAGPEGPPPCVNQALLDSVLPAYQAMAKDKIT